MFRSRVGIMTIEVMRCRDHDDRGRPVSGSWRSRWSGVGIETIVVKTQGVALG